MAIAPIGQAAGDIVQLARTNSMHYTASGKTGGIEGLVPGSGIASVLGGDEVSQAEGSDFGSAMLKALDGVNADQAKSNNLIEQAVVAPDTVDAHTLTTAMAEASLSLNLAKTLMSRVVTAWKDVINSR
jgi:flagellar hook-basal body complex protein FliE